MDIDLSKARETVRELLERLEALDGAEPDAAPTRFGQRERSEMSRSLQYMAHLGNRAAVEIMDVFCAYREWDQPGRRDDSAGT
ncbi:hypothetical protein [Streptomyces sp. AN091965]|uniref:hypothetical protein n=1 Tax=Streptomyces sp. AN091965 TaxID=2927803 RepID=UPI001F603862|nr:hypothetical protein [Streptomyces sp. AN091965]MCI3928807.1 hypothetical protein [Streptomyces sp. AN091965]